LTDKSFNLFRQSLAEQSFAGINPDVARGARHVWVLESFVSQPAKHQTSAPRQKKAATVRWLPFFKWSANG
jgi:hypothetical protein